MRGTVAKRIRRQVYGEMSQKQGREYTQTGRTLTATGLRREYQDAKKAYMRGRN